MVMRHCMIMRHCCRSCFGGCLKELALAVLTISCCPYYHAFLIMRHCMLQDLLQRLLMELMLPVLIMTFCPDDAFLFCLPTLLTCHQLCAPVLVMCMLQDLLRRLRKVLVLPALIMSSCCDYVSIILRQYMIMRHCCRTCCGVCLRSWHFLP